VAVVEEVSEVARVLLGIARPPLMQSKVGPEATSGEVGRVGVGRSRGNRVVEAAPAGPRIGKRMGIIDSKTTKRITEKSQQKLCFDLRDPD
jgi:hypothetical protein